MAKTVAEKLLVREGTRVLVLGAPQGWSLGAGEPPVAGEADAVLLFAPDAAALERELDGALAAVPHDGLAWVAYRKGGAKAGTDLNRDILQARLADHGVTGVTLVALDETWSAMRVRPTDRVGRR
ncbi:DUF3052 domain-containing protein [Kitasatospora viridis]|uniref:DUF3052 family protein n=1 Tax=Kitasatospora viridis TaxID=281105 RepID=A0A561UP51_9ACTN|nr:DUF3052 domain-containing protein [Kitasatospora viridis]TWG01148.1 hypothetical protein FHX73_115035 [Kitasatospora viridis]